ncbi:hypothetical protein K435DRAFT_872532 [Dendrothele bispora CBS 962.96]|uniref:Uncharacterized protein n=1 Tax=Dendrothele bispora (strain CBS 962.96) TaxID=1314807 RepID=A0A4S8L1T0_DENBC|nr:hypothetical protein K435DRAFT_872532 [Dendrothele bispora CBS 962.96]
MYSFSVEGVVRQMWIFDSTHESSVSSWYILEVAPMLDNEGPFLDVFQDLQRADPAISLFGIGQRDDEGVPYFLICLPSPLTLITTADYALTPNAYVVINFHAVFEQHSGKRSAVLVAETINILDRGLPWYSLYEDDRKRRILQIPI